MTINERSSSTTHVQKVDFETHLDRLFNDAEATAGLFGRRSMVWEVGRESIVVLGGGRAALLQLAHPYIAHAIHQHSTVLSDIQGRFQRTLSTMFAMTFGDRAEALRLARKIYAIHRGVTGEIRGDVGRFSDGHKYSALQIDAMFWVAATLWDTSILIFEATVRRLTPIEKEQYYQETKTFCRLFGIPSGAIPDTWVDFRRYFQDMLTSDTLAIDETARALAQRVLQPTRPSAQPMYAWLETFTASLLPRRFRSGFGLPTHRGVDVMGRGSLLALKRGLSFLPHGIRYCPAYLRANRRLSGRDGHDQLALLWRRLVLALLKQTGKRE